MNIPLRVLLVEDSSDDALLLVRELEISGYDVYAERVDTPAEMESALDRVEWDLVIADYTMPQFSGAAALALVRQRSTEAPFIFVSGTIGEDAAVAAMKVGADDYIMKGNLKRLAPAVKRGLRDAQVRRDRKRAEARVQYLAYFDPLTELPNRTLFHDRLKHTLALAYRENMPVALLMLDLDRFKDINDTLGHHTGDQLLHQVGQRLATVLRESDTAARLGGDEFAVVLPDTALDGAMTAARKIQDAINRPFTLDGMDLDVRTSIGIALFHQQGPHGQQGLTADDLLRQADVAMYLAKEAKSGFAIYTPQFDRHSPQRLALVADLRQAIDRGQLTLHYQPKVELRSGHVMGAEALVRWMHPTHGILLPSRFIGLSEQIGVIKSLTLWVLEQALGQCRTWREKCGVEASIAVNISAGNLQEAHFADQLSDILRTCHADPRWLELEITESVVMSDPSRAMEILTRLNRMGVRLAIDDFGTGQSSLSYLKRLPVSVMKIDRSFVMEMARRDDVIVRSTIDLAHNLGLEVIAEGVESEDIMSRLMVLGCDGAQGNFISGPIEGPTFAGWVGEWESMSVPRSQPERSM
jgi:diguanylate cyclase (GGDEF)-like protein